MSASNFSIPIIIHTTLGNFKVECVEDSVNKLNVVDPSSNEVVMVISDVHWFDKDGILRSIYDNKENIVKRLEEIRVR